MVHNAGNPERNLSSQAHCGVGFVPAPTCTFNTNNALLKSILLTLVSCVLFSLLFLLREFDDNRLLSWQWTLQRETLFPLLGLLALCHIVIHRLQISATWRYISVPTIAAATFLLGMTTWSLPEYMPDSSRYFTHAKIIAENGIGFFLTQWGNNINAWTDLPLISVIYGGAFSLFGETRIVIQLINTTLYTGAIYLTFRLGQIFWDHTSGINAALLLFAFPFLTAQPSQLLSDVASMFFVLLAIYFTALAIQHWHIKHMFLSCIGILLALSTKYSVWVVLLCLPALPLAIPISPSGHKWMLYKRLLSIFAATAAILCSLSTLWFTTVRNQLTLLIEYQLPAFSRWSESLLSTFLFQIHPYVTLAALAAIYIAWRGRDSSVIPLIIALAGLFLLGAHRARYLLIAFPMLALLAAYTYRTITDRTLRDTLVMAAAASGVLITLFVNNPFLGSISAVNLQATGRYLDSLAEPNVLVVHSGFNRTLVNPEIFTPLLDYYTSKNIYLADNANGSPDYRRHAEFEANPLRFTWSVSTYQYANLQRNRPQSDHLVIAHIISGDTEQLPTWLNINPNAFVMTREFLIRDRAFRLQTMIRVYRPKDNVPKLPDR